LRTDEDTSTMTARLLSAALVVGLATLVLATPARASAAPGRAVTNCNDSGPGSLRQAVRDAASGDTVTFALSPTCSTITLAGTIDIARNVTIDGPGANALAVSGNAAVEVFHIAAGVTAAMSGLTVDNGVSPYGGGIDNDGTLTLTDSILSDNSATTGGGAISNSGSLRVTDSTVSGNSASYYGGGIYSGPDATLKVADTTLSGNSATAFGVEFPEYAYGGAIYAYGTAAVTTSTVSDNTTFAIGGGGGGGGIYVGGTLHLTASTLSGNRATIADGVVYGDGGGGILNGGTLTVADTTLAGNSTNADGGGIANGWQLEMANSTLSANSAATGGAVFNDGTLTVAATIVADSTSGGDCSGTLTDTGYNLDDDGTCGFSASTDDSDTPGGLDPGGLQDNGGPTLTVALESGSAAIGAVNDALLCSTPDQRGVSRATPCDIGAVELVLTRQTIVFTSTPPSPAVVGGPSYSVSATGGESGNPVTLSVDARASSVCSIAGSTVTFIGEGTCVIDANQAGNSSYSEAAQVQQSFSVVPPAQAITSPDAATATAGSPFAFTVTTTGMPSPSLASRGTLPRNLTFVDKDNGTAVIAGIPVKAGVFHVIIRATFGKGRARHVVRQAFTLTVAAD
jgi:predicted outer membrane repeat protein